MSASGDAKGRVAVVEDDHKIANLLKTYLEGEGYAVVHHDDGVAADAAFQESLPDLVLLDLMLPGMDGLDVCRRLRARADVPIIMITARDSEVDRILGLELGADDYVTKPFSPREVMARVKAVMRRAEAASQRGSDVDVLRLGNLTVDPARREVRVGDDEVTLTAREFDLLEYLVRNRGIVMTRERILEGVWGYADYVDPRTVDVHVRQIRKKLAEGSPVETVWGVGYKAVAPKPAEDSGS